MMWLLFSGSSDVFGGRLSRSCVSSVRCLISRLVFCWRWFCVLGDECFLD